MTFTEALRPEPFRAWLVTQDPDEVFFQDSRIGCALATYLRQSGFPAAMVDPDVATPCEWTTDVIPLPEPLARVSSMHSPASWLWPMWDGGRFTVRDILARLDEAMAEEAA